MQTTTSPSLRDHATGVGALVTTLALWGVVFVAPDVTALPAVLFAGLRYLVHGAASLVLLRRVGAPTDGRTWGRALAHGAAGFVGYYALVSLAVGAGGSQLVVLVMATSPVVYTLAGRPAVRPGLLVVPLLAIVAGGVLAVGGGPLGAGGTGPLLATIALTTGAIAVWTWYGLDNARVVADPTVDLTRWTATTGVAAGLLSLPLVALGLTRLPTPTAVLDLRELGLVLLVGLLCTTVANRTWNAASRRLRPAVVGPLLVLETVFALTYAHAWAGAPPTGRALLGEVLLLAGAAGSLLVLRRGERAGTAGTRVSPAGRRRRAARRTAPRAASAT